MFLPVWSVNVFSRCYFRLSRFYEDAPAPLIALGLGIVSIAIALGGVIVENGEIDRMSHELARAGRLPLHSVRTPARPSAIVTLPQFSGAALVQGINNVAQEMAIPFDEASYVLDSSATIPYKKYRVTLKTMAGYAEIRRFIPALSAELPHLGLDSIHCARPDLAAAALSCELAFSAFYSKAPDE